MIVLNEKEYAEECLKSRAINKKPFFDLTILAKYYYHYCGYRKKKITELLTDYISKRYPYYFNDKLSWDDNILKIASRAGRFELYEIDGVWITTAEIKRIRDIHNKTLERLAFTMLCLAKLNNIKNPQNQGWVNIGVKEVFEIARISCSVDNRYVKLNALNKMGLLEFPKRNDNLSSRVTFINESSENVLFISDFRELGYEYLKYSGESFVRCQDCGILLRNNRAKTRKYCSRCAGYTPRRIKTMRCIDCGRDFEIKSKNNKSRRCADCQSKRDKERKKTWKRQKSNKDYLQRGD